VEAWIGLIGAIAGGTVAWALAQATSAITYKRNAIRNLQGAAFACLDRLLKVQSAQAGSDLEQTDKEIQRLGSDLDRYRDRIAEASGRLGGPHWAMYRKMIPVLLQHDLSTLDEVIAELETLAGAR